VSHNRNYVNYYNLPIIINLHQNDVNFSSHFDPKKGGNFPFLKIFTGEIN